MKLILRLIVAVCVGILIGSFAPESVSNIFYTIKSLLGQLVVFSVPLIVVFLVGSGISQLRVNTTRALGSAVALSAASTIAAGFLGLVSAFVFIPPLIAGLGIEIGVTSELSNLFDFELPPVMATMSALVVAFIFGIGAASLKSTAIAKGLDEGREIVLLYLTKIIIPILPIYVGTVFVDVAASGEVLGMLKTFGTVLALVILTQMIWLSTLFIIAGMVTKNNPVRLLKNMLPAYATGLGTMSSAATLPVTLNCVKKNKVSEAVANLVVPLCANIHLSGSIIAIMIYTTAVMTLMPGMEAPTIAMMIPFIFLLSILVIAAPGVPGGSIMASVGLLGSMFFFDANAIAIIIALYVAQDGFGTATNLTGDGAIAMITDKIQNRQ